MMPAAERDVGSTSCSIARNMLRHPLIRLAWCAIGMSLGIALALTLVAPPASPFLLASLGGSAVFLFGLTRAAAAQPRALFGGHLGTALIGIVCFQYFGDGLWVYCLAEVLALGYMLVARATHPPAGANPLIMIHDHAGYASLFSTVAVGTVSLVLLAVIWSRLYPGLARYPVKWMDPSPPTPLWGGWGE